MGQGTNKTQGRLAQWYYSKKLGYKYLRMITNSLKFYLLVFDNLINFTILF